MWEPTRPAPTPTPRPAPRQLPHPRPRPPPSSPSCRISSSPASFLHAPPTAAAPRASAHGRSKPPPRRHLCARRRAEVPPSSTSYASQTPNRRGPAATSPCTGGPTRLLPQPHPSPTHHNPRRVFSNPAAGLAPPRVGSCFLNPHRAPPRESSEISTAGHTGRALSGAPPCSNAVVDRRPSARRRAPRASRSPSPRVPPTPSLHLAVDPAPPSPSASPGHAPASTCSDLARGTTAAGPHLGGSSSLGLELELPGAAPSPRSRRRRSHNPSGRTTSLKFSSQTI